MFARTFDKAKSKHSRRRLFHASRGAAGKYSPRRKPWGHVKQFEAPEGRKKMSHTSGNILLHLIFSTEGRRPLIKPEFRDNLFAYIGGIVREMRATALIVNGEADHVHMLVRARPAHSAAEIACKVKANSSRWVREKHSRGFAWQTGYGVFSVSESSVDAVKKYIRGQGEHHQKRTFQEEYIAFLKKNHVQYDSRYIWD